MKGSSYHVIREKLDAYIEENRLRPGDRLPSELEMTKMFGVSRPTLRECIKLLQKSGLITTRVGSGNYLCDMAHRIKNSLSDLKSTGTMIQDAGFKAGQVILEVFHKDPEPEWAQKLRLAPHEKVVILKRLRTADDQPVALTWDMFSETLVGSRLDNGIDTAIFHHLSEHCGIHIASAQTEIFALDPADLYDEVALEMLGGQTLLLKQLHFNEKAAPVFYSLTYYRTDMIQLTLNRERNGN